jgi:hypothetical protein
MLHQCPHCKLTFSKKSSWSNHIKTHEIDEYITAFSPNQIQSLETDKIIQIVGVINYINQFYIIHI